MPVTVLPPMGGSTGGYIIEDPRGGIAGRTERNQARRGDRELQLQLADKSNLGQNLKQQRFEQIWPWMQGQTAQFGARPGQGNQPGISGGPVYGNQQISQATNAIGAQNQAATAASQRAMRERLGGRGFGGGSPLEQLLSQQFDMANRGQTSEQQRQFRQTAAQQNATQQLRGQQAQEQQFANRQQEDIARQRSLVGLLGGIGGLI